MAEMDAPRWAKLKEIFATLVEQPVGERARQLDVLCGDDAEMRREAISLLEAHDDTGRLIEPDGFGMASWLASQVPRYVGRRFGPYRILREIGHGGMGAVFLAERADGEFQRQVALKVMRRSLVHPEAARHFRRERQILATLNHPNIAHLLDGGVSEEGEPFLVMEHVEGVRIDEYCAQHGLAARERLSLFVKVCDAVAYAHERSIVHRDLKPSNILVTAGNEPKLLDFGIAKLMAPEETGERTLTVYRAFTPDFAAPEQASGTGPMTPAADVFSLGVLLDGLLNGLPAPGQASTGREVPRAVDEDGRAMAGVDTRSGLRLNRDLQLIIAKARRVDPARRYLTARELGLDVQRYLQGRPIAARPDSLAYRARKFVERRRAVLAASLVGAALAGALILGVTAPWSRTASGSEGVAHAAYPLADVKAIAVLPFRSMGAPGASAAAPSPHAEVPDDKALRVGMADSLVTRLNQLGPLVVRPISATLRYLDRDYDVMAVGRELLVDALLEGTVERVGRQLRTALQLVDATTGRVVWTGSLTSDLSNVLRGPASLANRVSELLAPDLARAWDPGREPPGTANLAAQDAYLRGRFAMNRAVRQLSDLLAAREAFEQAIDLDPSFAAAYAGLATAYTTANSLQLISPQEAYPKAERAARRAVALDPAEESAYIALAEYEADYNWNWTAAETNHLRAIELAPNSPSAHQSYAELLARLGRFEEAARHSDLALQLDPTRTNFLAVRALHYYYERRYDDAIAEARRALAADPDTYLARLYISIAYAAKGEPQAGIAAARGAIAITGGTVPDLFVLGCNYAVANDRANAAGILDGLAALERNRFVEPFLYLAIHAYLGDRDRAFEFLEKAYRQHSYWMTTLRVHPMLDPLRSDPRFAAMVARVNLN